MESKLRLEHLWALAFEPEQSRASEPHCPEIEILARRQQTAAAPDWAAAVSHVEAGSAHRAEGRMSAALIEFGMAFAHSAPATGILLPLVATLLAAGDSAAAETWARRMISKDSDTADVNLHLAHTLWSAERHDDALVICDSMIARFPHHAGAISTAATLHMLRGQPAKALNACLALLSSHDRQGEFTSNHYDLLVRAAIGSGQDLPPWCLELIEQASDSNSASAELQQAPALLRLRIAAREAWSDLFSADHAIAHPPQKILRTSPRTLLKLLLDAEPAPKIVSLHDLLALGDAYPEGLTRPGVLEEEGFDFPAIIDAAIAERGGETSDFGGRMTLCEPARRLQLAAVRKGQVTLISPFGDEVTSASSVVLFYRPKQRQNGCVICYFFATPRPLFVIFASEDIWPVAWYDPLRDIVLRHGRMAEFNDYLKDIIRELKFVLLCDPDSSRGYFSGDEGRRHKPVTVLFGLLDFLSTHLLNLQGLQRLIDADLIPSVASFVVTASEPLGPIEELFTEIPPTMIHRPHFQDVVDLNNHLWRNNALSVCVTGGWIETRVANRVLSRANTLVAPSWKRKVDDMAHSAYPIVFVSLRTSGRIWLVDPAEIADMFIELQKEYPNLAVVLDGYSLSNDSNDDGGIQQLVSGDSKLLGPVLERLAPVMTVLTSSGRSMEDAIYAAQASHMQLSAQGTSGTKALLIARKPGVLIGSRQFTFNIGAYRIPAPFLVMPWQDAIDTVERNCQCDYKLDPVVVLAALRNVAGKISPPKPR